MMQCKDIPDIPILKFLAERPWLDERPATWFWSTGYQPENSVVRAMPDGTSAKLARAKMSKLITKGFVAGCACGCRGDFDLAPRGREVLANDTPRPGG